MSMFLNFKFDVPKFETVQEIPGLKIECKINLAFFSSIIIQKYQNVHIFYIKYKDTEGVQEWGKNDTVWVLFFFLLIANHV